MEATVSIACLSGQWKTIGLGRDSPSHFILLYVEGGNTQLFYLFFDNLGFCVLLGIKLCSRCVISLYGRLA